MDDRPAREDPLDRASGPVPASERITSLDVVRGLAVLGILVMNVVEFGLPMRAYDNPAYAGGVEGVDLATFYVQATLFDGKMRALFSMLFGAGIVLIAERLDAGGGGARTADMLLRRCLWLVPFGVVHRFLLQWTGDILYIYGLLGMIAVPFRGLRPRTLAVLGILALAVFVPIGLRDYAAAARQRAASQEVAAQESAGHVVAAGLKAEAERWERRVQAVPPAPEAAVGEIAAMRGGWTDVLAYRWDHNHAFQSVYLYRYFVWDVLGMVFLGMALMKVGFFSGRLRTGVYAATIAVGALAALATAAWAHRWAQVGFSAAAIDLRLEHDVAYPFTRGLVGLAHASVLILVVRAGRARWLTAPLAAVGRMAFSNYVLQTLCCTGLFFGYGIGLYGSLSRAELMLVVLGVSLVQVAWSVAWLRAFRFGPLEWAWRALTYGQRPRFRK